MHTPPYKEDAALRPAAVQPKNGKKIPFFGILIGKRMPELPEVETVRRTLLGSLIMEQVISGVTVAYPRIISGSPDDFVAAVSGQTIRDIDRLGKYLVFVLDDKAFLSHLRMEGKYHIIASETPLDKHEHIIFHLQNGYDLRYHDVRKFGRMELVGKDDYRQTPPLNQLGPEPWEAEPSQLYEKLKRSSLPIKSLLLDQRVLAGIGNIYANEICYLAGLCPTKMGNQLKLAEVERVLEAAREVLEKAIELGGSTIHSFTAGGVSGRFQNELRVHGRESCPVCQSPIVKIAVGGRGTYYCPNCQK
jgi:formamidopyrimidine-DNA glycosylase